MILVRRSAKERLLRVIHPYIPSETKTYLTTKTSKTIGLPPSKTPSKNIQEQPLLPRHPSTRHNASHANPKFSSSSRHPHNLLSDTSSKDETLSSLPYHSRRFVADGICSGNYIFMLTTTKSSEFPWESRLILILFTLPCHNSPFDAVSYNPMRMSFQSHVLYTRRL